MAKEQIKSLTAEQEALIPVYRENYRKICLSTDETDKAKAEAAVIASYAYLKLGTPEIMWADDPFVGAKLAAQFAKGDTKVTAQEIADQANKASYGSFEAQWVVFYSYISDVVVKDKKDNLIDIVNDIVKHCGVYWTFEDLVILTPKPVEIHLNDEGQLHNETGMALKYATGRGIYALNGTMRDSLADILAEQTFRKKIG